MTFQASRGYSHHMSVSLPLYNEGSLPLDSTATAIYVGMDLFHENTVFRPNTHASSLS